jgi:hypothetical protein
MRIIFRETAQVWSISADTRSQKQEVKAQKRHNRIEPVKMNDPPALAMRPCVAIGFAGGTRAGVIQGQRRHCLTTKKKCRPQSLHFLFEKILFYPA